MEKTTEKEVDDDDEAEESSAPKEEEEEGKIEEVLLLHAISPTHWQSCRSPMVCSLLYWPLQHTCCVTHTGPSAHCLHDAAIICQLWCMQHLAPELHVCEVLAVKPQFLLFTEGTCCSSHHCKHCLLRIKCGCSTGGARHARSCASKALQVVLETAAFPSRVTVRSWPSRVSV